MMQFSIRTDLETYSKESNFFLPKKKRYNIKKNLYTVEVKTKKISWLHVKEINVMMQ